MAVTKLQLYNGALRLLGERKVKADEDRLPRYVMDDIWDEDILKDCLEAGQWQWATRTVELQADNALEPAFGYSYAFEEPDDVVQLVGISSNERMSTPLTRYKYYRRIFFTDIDPLYISYVSDDVEYGRDLSLMPQSFIRYVQAVMAFEASSRITGVKVDMEKLENLVSMRLRKAHNKDGVTRPTTFPPRGGWNNSRNGGGSSTRDNTATRSI